MRRAAVVVGLGLAAAPACGRVGFDNVARLDGGDPIADGAGGDGAIVGDDAGPDAAPSCSPLATQILGLSLADEMPVRGLAVSFVPEGYAVGLVRADHTALDGVLITDALIPTQPQPQRTTPIIGAQADYIDPVLQWDGSHLLSGLYAQGDGLYWKVFPTSMAIFTSAVQVGDARAADPFLATIAGVPVAVSGDATGVAAHELDSAGIPTGLVRHTATASPVALAAGTLEDRAFAVAEDGSGDCALVTIDQGSGSTAPIGPCHAPHLAQEGATVHLVYTTSQGVVLRDGTIQPAIVSAVVALGAEQVLGPGADPRVAFDTGQALVVWRLGTGFQLAHATVTGSVVRTTPTGLPAGAPDAWSLTVRGGRARVFAAYGSELWTFTPCD